MRNVKRRKNNHCLAKQCELVSRFGHIFREDNEIEHMTSSVIQFQVNQVMMILKINHLNMVKMKILIIFYNLKMRTIEEIMVLKTKRHHDGPAFVQIL